MAGGIGGLFGGGMGGDFKAQSADVLNPVSTKQTDTAYDQTQQGLAQQQAFLQALQAQNGLGNQTNVFNQMQGVANGTGPNPAQAMLANTTSANMANQAAQMAGQRGTAANAGLLARQAAMQGANLQQQAAGQAAALQAQQSLGALNQMGGIAGQQAQQQQGGLNAYNQAALGQQANLLGAVAHQNQANVSNTQQQNAANAQVAVGNQSGQQNLMSSVSGMMGPAMDTIGKFGSGMGDMFGAAMAGTGGTMMAGGAGDSVVGDGLMAAAVVAEGGKVGDAPKVVIGPKSKVGQHLHAMAKGGKVPALVSPGERYLSPNDVKKVEKGADPMSAGEIIPGKPKVKGAKNSYANDTVHKNLDEGGIILPRSVTQSKNPHWAAHKFVQAIMAKNGNSLPSKKSSK